MDWLIDCLLSNLPFCLRLLVSLFFLSLAVLYRHTRNNHIEGTDIRPGVGEFKEETSTLAVRGTDKLPQTESGALDFLRVGYGTTTWWEDDREEVSPKWRI